MNPMMNTPPIPPGLLNLLRQFGGGQQFHPGAAATGGLAGGQPFQPGVSPLAQAASGQGAPGQPYPAAHRPGQYLENPSSGPAPMGGQPQIGMLLQLLRGLQPGMNPGGQMVP